MNNALILFYFPDTESKYERALSRKEVENSLEDIHIRERETDLTCICGLNFVYVLLSIYLFFYLVI
jgi:hypothetical protein